MREKTFIGGEIAPVFVGALNFNASDGVIENDFSDGVFDYLIATTAIVSKLPVETRNDALIKNIALDVHEIAGDV